MKRICLVVADATRARILTYQRLVEPDGPHEQLQEHADLIDPARRQRPTELFSDGSGGNHVGPRATALDDHREAHLAELDAVFAKEIAAATTKLVHDHGYPQLVVCASSRMIGPLRATLEPLKRTVAITDFQRDYTRLPVAELRERLVELAVLPPRISAPM
jgi:protein required for attachment to host cells